MRSIVLALAAIIIAMPGQPLNAGIRCANDIISTGETTSQVQMKLQLCGEVLSKEVVGEEAEKVKQGDEQKERKKLVERWYIRVQERGGKYCYPLTFEEGILQNIGNWSKCD